MVGRIWPTGAGTLATAATAAGFHTTPFWTAVFSSTVGLLVASVGMYLQWKWKRDDRLKEDIILQKDTQILQQQRIISDLHYWMEEMSMTGHRARVGETTDGSGI